ncbi:MAG: hypothetical protein NVSMB18_35620 [Acetobacteraceae bacterium]
MGAGSRAVSPSIKAGLDDLALGWSLRELSEDIILDLALAGSGLALLTVGWIWVSDRVSPSVHTVLRAGQAAVCSFSCSDITRSGSIPTYRRASAAGGWNT